MGQRLGSFFVLNLPFFDLFAQGAFRISHLQWSLTDDVPSKALVAKNLTQYGGGLVILNSSAGPAAADEKPPVTRTATHQLSQLSPATSQQFNSMCGMIEKPNVGTVFAVVLLRCTVLY